MISFTGKLDVDQPPGGAFDLLADMTELDLWNPSVESSRRITGERLELGSTYESTIVRGLIRMTARSVLISVEPGRRVCYEGSIGMFWSIDSLTFEQSGAGTRITFENESSAPSWLRPLTPLMNFAFQPQARKAVNGAAQYLAKH